MKDCAPDVSRKKQLSIIIRIIDMEYKNIFSKNDLVKNIHDFSPFLPFEKSQTLDAIMVDLEIIQGGRGSFKFI